MRPEYLSDLSFFCTDQIYSQNPTRLDPVGGLVSFWFLEACGLFLSDMENNYYCGKEKVKPKSIMKLLFYQFYQENFSGDKYQCLGFLVDIINKDCNKTASQ